MTNDRCGAHQLGERKFIFLWKIAVDRFTRKIKLISGGEI
jgi:hypothetical protein